MIDTQASIELMISNVHESHQLFSKKRSLKHLVLEKLELERILQLIDQVQLLHKASSRIGEFMELKQYSEAVDHLTRAQTILWNPEMMHLDCTTGLHEALLDSKHVGIKRLSESRLISIVDTRWIAGGVAK